MGSMYDNRVDDKPVNVENTVITEDMLEELRNILKSDRHERVMEAFEASWLREKRELPVA
jgi:hypothetical protein